MNDESKEVAKIWKIVAWILLSLALLLSVLIISQTWFPELQEPQNESNPDKLYKWIVATIALVASVSLLSFLIQIYMKKPEETPKIWKIIAYPVHWVFRLATRFLLVAIRLSVAILLFGLLIIITLSFNLFNLALSKVFAENLESLKILSLAVFFFLIAMVLIPRWFQRHGNDIWNSLLETKEKISEALRGGWWPGLDVRESLSETCQHFGTKIQESCGKTSNVSKRLFYAALILSIAVGVYQIVIQAVSAKEWKVILFVPTLEHNHDHSYPDFISNIDSLKSDMVKHSHPDLENRISDHSHNPATSYPFKKNAMFSLVYREGNLETKEGICPGGSNLKWLRLFKAAISDSLTDKNEPLRLNVQGFASIAPVLVEGRIDSLQSDSLNCEIANQRAEAVIHFLTTNHYDSTICGTAIDNYAKSGRALGELISRGRPDTLERKVVEQLTETSNDSPRAIWKGPRLIVTYIPWKSYEDMEREKPSKDISSSTKRRRDLEFLDRSVQISVE